MNLGGTAEVDITPVLSIDRAGFFMKERNYYEQQNPLQNLFGRA